MTGASVRSTRQRAAISALLETLDDFRSAQELHDELRRRGENIGLTTVYRTLQSMAAAGMVDTLRTDTVGSIIAGRKPLSAWDGTVKKMKSMGLDRIAEDYAKDYAANH